MHTKESQVDVGGTVVHYREAGSGPPLVMLHGAPTSSRVYDLLLPELSAHFRCIAPDFPGWGASPPMAGPTPSLPTLADIGERFIRALGLHEVTLMGMDTAGTPTLEIVRRAPELVRALVLADTVVYPIADFPRMRRMLRLVTSGPFRALNRWLNLVPGAVAWLAPGNRRLSREERRRLLDDFSDGASRDRVIDVIEDLYRNVDFVARASAVIPGLALPLLVVFGENDPARKVGVQARLETDVRDVTSVVVPGEGHFPQIGDPETYAGALIAWADAAGIIETVAGAADGAGAGAVGGRAAGGGGDTVAAG